MAQHMGPTSNAPTRKQNVACDACRAKKVRCLRASISQKCEQCIAKDLECTSNYIEQLQNKPRRPRRFKQNSEDGGTGPIRGGSGEKRSSEAFDSGNSSTRTSPTFSVPPSRHASGNVPVAGNSSVDSNSAGPGTMGVEDAMAMIAWMNPAPPAPVFTRSPAKDPSGVQADLLRYLFCPTPALHYEWRYSDTSSVEQAREGRCDLWEEAGGVVWDEAPSAAHLALWAAGERELESLAADLIDSFFAIVNSRLPILDLSTFLSRFANPGADPLGPIAAGQLAVVLAFGAKFSENATIIADRDECSARDADMFPGRTRSRLVQLLTIRAREVAEMNKTCRIPSWSNIQTNILLEGLVAQSPVLKRRYQATYFTTAARLLAQLLEGPQSAHISYGKDEKYRTHIALYVIAGFESAFHRLRADAFDFVVDLAPALVPSASQLTMMNPGMNGPLSSEDDTWLAAARAAAVLTRKLCSELWVPRVSATGVPLCSLRDFVHEHSSWREAYLPRLGVPRQWPESWDFVAAIKACSTDVFYHALWLVVDRAVRDYGIQEADGMMGVEVGQMSDRLRSEALHAALRIAALSAVLLEHGYLRLDPLVLYRPMYDAGIYLARNGREECHALVTGLRQYAGPYPQMWDLALDIEATLMKSSVAQPMGGVSHSHVVMGGVGSSGAAGPIDHHHISQGLWS